MRLDRPVRRWPALLLVTAVAAMLMASGSRPAQAEPAAMVYFDATGQTLGGPFLTEWLNLGGMDRVGAPISQPSQQGEKWVQWFQFGRFEINKPTIEEATDADVSVVPLGQALAEELGYTRWNPAFKPVDGASWAGQRFFPETGHTLGNAFLATWDKGDTGQRLGAPISQEFSIGDIVYQYFQLGALSWSNSFGVGIVPIGMLDAGIHGQLRLTGTRPDGVPSYGDRVFLNTPGLSGERWIDINLSTYTLTAFVGNTAVMSTSIVDGAPATPTITGEFYVYWKLESQTMRGRNTDGTEYVTEGVPWVMYFYQDWAVHGAYWRSSFGYSGSHGCVNLPVDDAAALFQWASVGTRVEVHN